MVELYEFENIIKNLMEISKIPENAKIKVNTGDLQIDAWSWIQGFSRYFSGENREASLKKLNEIYNKAILISQIIMEAHSLNRILLRNTLTTLEFKNYKKKASDLSNLSEWLSASLRGLEKLNATYNASVTDIEILRTRVEKQLYEIIKFQKQINERESQIKILDRNRPESIVAEGIQNETKVQVTKKEGSKNKKGPKGS